MNRMSNHAAISHDHLARWSAKLALAMDNLGTDVLPEALSAAVRTLVKCDCALVLAYHPERRPVVLFDDFNHPLRRNRIEAYLRGAYLLDPLFQAALECKTPALVRMKDVAPEEFERSEYFLGYYKRSKVSDEVNFFAPVDGDICLAISIERASNNEAFSNDHLAVLDAVKPLVAAMLVRHWELSKSSNTHNGRDVEHERLVSKLGQLGEGLLTEREQQVTQMVLKGHSNYSIADILGLSIETVKVHRRNIYRKLNISSVSELYSIALEQVLSA